MALYSIGHSTHPLTLVLGLLGSNGIEAVVDVRSSPYSRRSPDFDLPNLRDALGMAGVRYVHTPELGGRPQDRSLYDADGHVLYRQLAGSQAFRAGIERLLVEVSEGPVALLCSEEDPLRCHRWRLIGSALDERGVEMIHLRGDGRLETHRDVLLRDEAEHPEMYQLELIESEEDYWRSTKPVRTP